MLLKNLAVALGVEVLGFRTPHPLPFGCPEGMFELPCCHQCRWNSTVMSRRATHNPKVGGSNPPPQPKLLHFQSYKDSAASTALSVISSGHRKHCVRWLATGCSGKTRKSSRSLPQRIWSSDIYVIRDRSIPFPTLRIKADAHCQSFHLLRWALNQHSGISAATMNPSRFASVRKSVGAADMRIGLSGRVLRAIIL
jgi:hypothetical protein